MSEENPKLKGSNIIDCIPQTGECPNQCSECFYNGGRFFRTLDEPLIPSPQKAKDKTVRINSGHDSNIQIEKVLAVAQHYGNCFCNTSIPKFDFPNLKTGLQIPVVFTANRQCPQNKIHLVENPPENLMFVRARVSPMNIKDVDKIVSHYWEKHKIPVVLTFMRYYNGDLIPDRYKDNYEWKEHVENEYWMPKIETVLEILTFFKGYGVRMCGTPVSSACKDCRNCEFLYWDCLRRMGR